MNEDSAATDSVQRFERRSRELFEASVDRVDMRVRSRLNQARHAALAATPSKFAVHPGVWAPAFGAAAVLVIGVAIWGPHAALDVPPPISATHSGYEDLDIVASNDPLDLLQDDIEFYDWIASAPASKGSAGAG